ncbi:hypothetical protein T01_5224 [Trichinella spiralis]|uniref:Uncharacterized protein n=1 Tax=Trichinella spiralis TaxID=6334 RepID=A0A0V1BMK0_TRISP|nr:hypothetical protein T01_5224 [Trichinella spiralis]
MRLVVGEDCLFVCFFVRSFVRFGLQYTTTTPGCEKRACSCDDEFVVVLLPIDKNERKDRERLINDELTVPFVMCSKDPRELLSLFYLYC